MKRKLVSWSRSGSLLQAEEGIGDLLCSGVYPCVFFFSSRRRHTRSDRDWSSDVCSSDLVVFGLYAGKKGNGLNLYWRRVGLNGLSRRARSVRLHQLGAPSTSHSRISRRRRMENKIILLVEDDPRDEALILRALRKSNAASETTVARDGEEALDYLFGTGAYAGRDLSVMPQVVLLDLKLPKADGLEVL